MDQEETRTEGLPHKSFGEMIDDFANEAFPNEPSLGRQLHNRLTQAANERNQVWKEIDPSRDPADLYNRLAEGIRQAHAGETKDLGDFSQYLEENDDPEVMRTGVQDWEYVRREPQADLMPELAAWWRKTAHQDSELVSRKYQEYGNTALLEVGQQLADVMGRKNVTKAEAQELGIWFFMVGKMARWKTAILKGERVSKDTLDDLAVYAFMARRLHEKGGWPDA